MDKNFTNGTVCYGLFVHFYESETRQDDVNNASLKAIRYFLGANLRSGEVGIFPLAHVVDVEYSDFDPDVMSSLLLSENEKKERFLLDYLGSVETSLYKGNIVLCQAVKKIYSKEEDMCQLPTVLQITAKGIKMQNKVNNQVSLPSKRPRKSLCTLQCAL